MTDHKFTDDDVIKALEVHSDTEEPCLDKCPYSGNRYCGSKMASDALALINRQKVEIESLKIANEKMYSANKEQEAEIESLNAVHADMTESLRLAAEANKDMSAELKAMRGAANSYKMHYENAIKEFAERLKEKAHFSEDFGEAAVACYDIDTLVKEMMEVSNG